MSVDVEIKLVGLALCFLKPPPSGTEDVWNIAFLCDKHHPLKLKINGAAQPAKWRPANKDITFFVQHSGTRPCGGENQFRRLLNLSDDDYGHGADPADSELSNLKIKRVKNVADLVWMQVPHSELDVDGEEDTKIMRTSPDHGIPARVADCGKAVKLTFQVDSNIRLMLNEYPSGNPYPPAGAPAILPDPVPAVDGKIALEFDNRCLLTGGCKRNDFVDIYEFVEHKNRDGHVVKYISWAEDIETEKIRFHADPVLDRIQRDRLNELLRDGWEVIKKGPDGLMLQRARTRELIANGYRSPYGNCDPVGSEPPPGP